MNMSHEMWLLPGRKILLEEGLQTRSREQLMLKPMGWCVLEGR